MKKRSADKILACAYQCAEDGAPSGLDKQTAEQITVIVDHAETNKGVLSVCLTLMLKKAMSPEQDIRLHQAGMTGGFSARVLDTKLVTPFLRAKGFPFMVAGAGALTRSLEQAMPYNMKYSGKISPRVVRDAFLECVDRLQNGCCDAENAMHHLLHGLIIRRNRNKNLKLVKPQNHSITIAATVEMVSKHFNAAGRGGSHLPVLAIYAVYKQMISEVGKYRKLHLCDLQSHTSPDQKSGFLGDIQINDDDGKPVEAVEIKHGIKLTPQLITECYDKFKAVPSMHTYYLLSTDERMDHIVEISERALWIHQNHGCQMIANGIQSTLRYYLRLLSSTDNFLADYVGLVEQECSYDIKMLWTKLWENS